MTKTAPHPETGEEQKAPLFGQLADGRITCPRIDFEIRKSEGSLGVGDMMAAVMAHSSYWESPDFVRAILDLTPGFRTVPGRDQELAGKGSRLHSLAVFGWNLWTFKTGSRRAHQIEKGWKKTSAAVVHTVSAAPSQVGMVYACSRAKKTIYKIDPHKLSGYDVRTKEWEDNLETIQGYAEEFCQGPWDSTVGMVILDDRLYVFGENLHIIDLVNPQFQGHQQLTKGWVNTKAVGCDGKTIYAVGNTRQGNAGALYTVGTDGISDYLVKNNAFHDAKGLAVLGNEVFIVCDSIWAIDKTTLTVREVAQGWNQTVAMTSDHDWIYLVTSTGFLPHLGSIWRIDVEGRSECLSTEDWGQTRSLVVWPEQCGGSKVEGSMFDPTL